jgi:hypothetical protein
MSILNKLAVKDRPGTITVSEMRLMFEAAVNATGKLNGLPLEACKQNGQFHYTNTETDCAWFGFALGLRCAERIELNGKFVAAKLR